MKPSELKKDGNFSGRINNQVKKELRKLGVSVQDIVDAYIDAVLKTDIKVLPKYTKGGSK